MKAQQRAFDKRGRRDVEDTRRARNAKGRILIAGEAREKASEARGSARTPRKAQKGGQRWEGNEGRDT